MKLIRNRIAWELVLAVALTLAAVALVALNGAGADENGAVRVTDAWARATIGNAANSVAYLSIANAAAAADRIEGASSPAAKAVEVHVHIKDGDVMKMRRVRDGVEIPAGGTVAFAPGGLHLMLIGVNAPLREGGEVELTLRFSKAGDVKVVAPVRKSAPKADGKGGDIGGHRGSHR